MEATMPVPRHVIERVFGQLRELSDRGELDRWPDLFSEDCVFSNSMLPDAIVGREKIRAMARLGPKLENEIEWSAIDDGRLVYGWRERKLEPEVGGWYRGVAIFLFGEDGLISKCEAIFDTRSVIQASSTVDS
jgi:hypothetical protein